MKLLGDFFKRHKLCFELFVFIILYQFVVVLGCRLPEVDPFHYQFYVVDFDMGFASRILPGAMCRFFVGEFDKASLLFFLVFSVVFFFLLLSFLLEKWLLAVPKEDRTLYGVVLLLFLTGTFTFSVFVKDFGIPEFYWAFFSLLAFFCLRRRFLYWALIPLCGLILLVNYSAVLCYIPFLCICVLYKISTEKEKKTRLLLWPTFGLMVIGSIGFFIYLVVAGKGNMKYSFETFNEILAGRGVDSVIYIDYFLYGKLPEQAVGPDSTLAVFEAWKNATATPSSASHFGLFLQDFVMQLRFVFSTFSADKLIIVLFPFVLALPVFAFSFRYFLQELRNRNNPKLKRFVSFCMPALFFLTLGASLFFSSEFLKWFSFAFLPYFSMLLYVMYLDRERVTAFLRERTANIKKWQVLVYGLLYMSCSVHVQD